jgi:hypothetical protein
MRARLFLVAGLGLAGAGTLRAEKLPSEFRAAFEQKFWARKTYAVVMQKGIPTTSIYGVKGDSQNAHYSVDIVDGNWRTSEGLLDFDQVAADYLALGEVMELTSVSYKDNRVDLSLVSVESKKVSRGSGFSRKEQREPVSTYFKIFFPVPKSKVMTASDVPMALEYVGRWLQPFPDEASARAYAARLIAGGGAPPPAAGTAMPASRGAKPAAVPAGGTVSREIKPGMTALEVIDILGRPQKEVTFQNTTRWTYPDLTVIFENGKVKEVRF